MMRIKRCGGIDVGLSSAVAAVYGYDGANGPRTLGVFDIPTIGQDGGKRIDVKALWRWASSMDAEIWYVEMGSSMPDPATGARMGNVDRYLRACGAIEAAVTLTGSDMVSVPPAVWKRSLRLVGPNKGQSIARAIELDPSARRWLPTKVRNGVVSDVQKFHNRAEAILIAVYAAIRCDMIDLREAA